MKSLLAIILVLALLGATAFAGYSVLKQRQAPPPPPSSASSKPKEQPKPQNALQEELLTSTTDPETLEKLLYEIKKNTDTVGWLKVPGTDIDNSVVQSHNNNYYLRRDERGKDSVYGCYFADYECSVTKRDELLPNTIIYGHSDLKDNADGVKFSQLFRYNDKAFASENNVITLSTPEETLEWEVFAAFYTDIRFNYITVNNTPEVQQSIVDTARQLSVHDFGVKPTGNDKILTLSTCSVRDGNDGKHRFVVMARLK